MSKPSNEFKRLFWDIETSYNIVSSWRVGNQINLSHENIIKERAIICICYKWQGDDKVYSLNWDKGDDSKMIKAFVKILNKADESVGHNSDRFDEKWVRARALYHGIQMFPKYQTLDTLKAAKAGFNFNSNRLDYLGKYMGFNGKLDTGGLRLWDDIILRNSRAAMKTMIDYCKRDVELLEKVYNKISEYSKPKTHYGVVTGESKCSCSHCGSEERKIHAYKTSATGVRHIQFQCKSCHRFYQVALTTWNTYNKLNMKT